MIRRQLESLASVITIDVLTYAILSNHLHFILCNRPNIVAQWSDDKVAIRWLRVFSGNDWGITWPIHRQAVLKSWSTTQSVRR